MTASRPLDPELTRLSPFRILRTLARGGMSEVYLGQKDGPFDGPDKVVLKVLRLPRDVPSDAPRVREMLARLIEEGRLGLRLSHPAIAQSYGVLRDHHQDLYFLVQEFVDGLTLGDLMDYYSENGQRIPYGVVLRLIIPVLQALHYGYHTATREDGRPLRVVHRDIKPDNIMLSYAGQVKLVDFGVARSTSLTRQVTVGDVVVGTRHYMAPEQVFTPDQVGHRADLFSLGLILYELCTLKPVFPRTRAVSEFAQALANFKFEDHAGLIDAKRYPGIREVLFKVLQAEARDRYAAAGEMARDLQELEAQAPANPTMVDFAIELKSEIAEAEGAATMMGAAADEGAKQPQATPAPARTTAPPPSSRNSLPGRLSSQGIPPVPSAQSISVQPWDARPAPPMPRQERPASDRAPVVEPWDAPVRRPSIIPGSAASTARPQSSPPAPPPPLPPMAGAQSLMHPTAGSGMAMSPGPGPSTGQSGMSPSHLPGHSPSQQSGPQAPVRASLLPPQAPTAGYPDVLRSSQTSMPPTPVVAPPRNTATPQTPTSSAGTAPARATQPQAPAPAQPSGTALPQASPQAPAAPASSSKALVIGIVVVVVLAILAAVALTK